MLNSASPSVASPVAQELSFCHAWCGQVLHSLGFGAYHLVKIYPMFKASTRGMQKKGYFSFCPPFPVLSMYALLLDSISQNLCKTRNKTNMSKTGGKLLKNVSDGSHELKKNFYNVVVY